MAQDRNLTNLQFYYGNAEDMYYLETESFDFINFAYVLHEMPGENAMKIVDEMYRLLMPGGSLNG